MFDRLDDILIHYEELMLELNNPSVAEDQNRFHSQVCMFYEGSATKSLLPGLSLLMFYTHYP